MFVLELRGYMQNADAAGELDPVGRISRARGSSDGDGVYETHKVFVDNLVFPRFVHAVRRERHPHQGIERRRGLEVHRHERRRRRRQERALRHRPRPAAERRAPGERLRLGLDNWIYSTINSVRIRWTPSGVLREPTGSNGGQWGVTQDNYGKMLVPGRRQRHARLLPVSRSHYGNFTYPEQFEPDLNITWGAPVLIADMQGGMNVVRMPDGSLARATGCGRQRRLPRRSPAQGLIGDYFYGEVVARIVRRLHPGQDRRADAAAERLSAVRVHPLDRSAVPPGRRHDRAGRHDVHHRHVPRHHPGIAVVGPGHLPAHSGSISTGSTRSSGTAASGG